MAATTADIAARWRARAELALEWLPAPNQTSRHGESRGFEVYSPSVEGRRCYLKPRKVDRRPYTARAAREKICSDLAADLGVPVPPAILCRRAGAQRNNEEAYVVVTLFMYPTQFHWGSVRDTLDDGDELSRIMRTLLPHVSARAFAFDTWVLQGDHNDHDSNISFGYDPSEPSRRGYVFLDYAMALRFGLEADWEQSGAAGFPPRMKRDLDTASLAEAVSNIEALPESRIRDVVGRIPQEFLPPDDASQIIQGLVARQALVRGLLEEHMGKS